MFKGWFTRRGARDAKNAVPSSHLIDLRNIVKTFESAAGSFTALKGVSLTVDRGEFVAVIGKSGSGKSTLINMVTGIDRPTSGEVFVGGTPVHTLSEGQMSVWRGKNLGIIFQFFQLLPSLSVIENVMLPMDFCNMYRPRERRERAMMLLEQVEMTENAHKLPSAISGGQQQRVAIARALANDPPILIADEPTGNLDSKTAEAVFRLFEELVAAEKTIVMVTHDNDLARRASRSVIVADGEIVNQYLAQALPRLSLDQLITVTRQLDRLSFAPGQPIVHQGNPADYFYVITRGQVEVIIDQPGGGELVAEVLNQGQYFGELGLLDADGMRRATVRAAHAGDEVEVVALDRAEFHAMLDACERTRADVEQVAGQRRSNGMAA
ncbi:ABC transporter ATP-binding protein [Candidatus Viridilinea mediisalina]|uniref:Cyclic nucleotide-binding protein n=1 Tax=Candidatus Viridilinea mediisalina TaxID=2024553 RepID=A0A2A6RMY4_9CHLR|nr:ATP-binding cassette domain-containing protein [Candidatus Viridilinea mediisalina]PDW04285.1 cyclic nucleotide-binding protein [Candidatus Viridilinea mediisalina]